MLSDRDISHAIKQGWIGVKPDLRPEQLQPASIDLDLGCDFVEPGRDRTWTMEIGAWVQLQPGEFMLATTLQTVTIGPSHVGRVEGKSSFGRLGLTVHITAGFIDPGFTGQVTLEMVNLSRDPVHLNIGRPICQMSFEALDSRCDRPYGSPGLGSHYQNQHGVQKSAIERG